MVSTQENKLSQNKQVKKYDMKNKLLISLDITNTVYNFFRVFCIIM